LTGTAALDSSRDRTLQILFAICFLLLLAATTLYLAFLDRSISFDEAGLANPSYMLLHYGRITYPIHGQFDGLVVHPPTHYLGIALLMNLGLGLFHAAAVMPVLCFAAAGFLLLFSRIAFPARFGLLFGIYLGAVIWTSTQTVRPDLSLALAWIAGLIALESARLADWNPNRLFVGSVLLGYAAVVHYPGAFCWTGIVVYIVWAWLSLPRRAALARIVRMIAGLAVVGIPYLFLFLIPFHREIAEVVSQHQGEGGLWTAIQHHRDAYAAWSNLRAARFSMQPLVQTLLTPLWWSRIPAAFIGPTILLAFRSTRGLALAALPQVLFIALGARHKDTRFSGYFTPEMILYLTAAVSVALAALFFVSRKIPSRIGGMVLALLGVATLSGFALHDKPDISGGLVRLTRSLSDLDLSRAAAREIAGPDAFIGSTSLGVWYTGGGTHFLSVSPEIQYGPSLTIRPKEYAAWFDGLVVDQLESWVTWNKERANLTSLYLSGDLRLKGFWLGEKHAGAENELSWMMYAAPESPLRGFTKVNGRVYRFDQAANGSHIFYCAVCTSAELRNNGQFQSYGTMYFPAASNDDPRTGGDATPLIRMLLVSKEQFQRDVVPAAAHCKVRDQIAGNLVEMDSGAMLAQLQATDRTIRFYRSFPTALAGTNRLSSANTSRVPGIVELSSLHATGPDPRVAKTGDSFDVTTAPERWWDAAAVPVHHTEHVERGFIYIRGKVLSGVVGITLRGRDINTIIGSEAMWGANDGVNELYIPIASLEESDQVVIRNQRPGGPSEVLIEDIAVVIERPDVRRGTPEVH
jgi:hypothetical protein